MKRQKKDETTSLLKKSTQMIPMKKKEKIEYGANFIP